MLRDRCRITHSEVGISLHSQVGNGLKKDETRLRYTHIQIYCYDGLHTTSCLILASVFRVSVKEHNSLMRWCIAGINVTAMKQTWKTTGAYKQEYKRLKDFYTEDIRKV